MIKQYLVMVDDLNMALLGKIIPGLQYLPVEGMTLQGQDVYQMLVSPLPKPQEVALSPAVEDCTIADPGLVEPASPNV